MKTIIGFRIGRRVSRWILRNTQIRRSGYNRLHWTRPVCKLRPLAKLKSWGQRLTQRLYKSTKESGYMPDGYKKPDPVPRGHLAIYVGQKDGDGDFHRVFVPIVYFNHPLFGELLNKAEKEYGFCHEGGITIPCPYSDFERVKTRIASGSSSRIFPWGRLCRN
ncbi:Auxin-responsive protein SAUR36 [Cardamine amara subsp. amara]|uniref:Auxin-responsive protein SAUR36 n=1 Tax=Cardamine amara subsp. amara TaxID=228776 RepID=A0ABD1C2C0_CARAN